MRLLRLQIDDFGLIARADVRFDDGLTVLSGETGSGKTMLLGALEFVLGARTGADAIRTGAERARVALEVELDAPALAGLRETGIEAEKGETLVVTRELARAGRSSARINGVAVASAQLRDLGDLLIDLVGQHEQQRLLAPAYHLDLVDRFGGSLLAASRERVASLHAKHAALVSELGALTEDENRIAAEFEFAEFARDEIAAAAPQPGEDERLRERRDYLANTGKIADAVQAAHDALAREDGAEDALGAAAAGLGAIARFDAELEGIAQSLGALQAETNEIAIRLARALEATEFEPEELEITGERLALLERLKKKYGGTIEAVLAARERFEAQVDRHSNRDEIRRELEVRRDDAARDLGTEGEVLTGLRMDAAHALEAAVEAELAALAMPAARLTVGFVPVDPVGPDGAERGEFLLAPNPGEPARPLAKSASGGELSRVLLALVVAIADRRERRTLVFDEIDAGIGGATANAVGARLGRLARTSQVLCVTHLAQIAAWGDLHYSLRKTEDARTTNVGVVELDAQARLEEIARMLSGNTRGVSLDHAAEMLRDVDSHKHALELAT